MALQGRSRRGRQVATGVPATRSTNRVQESDEASDPHNTTTQNTKESTFDRFA